jgi:hypothetical protein
MTQPIFGEFLQSEIGRRCKFRGFSAYAVRWFDVGEEAFVSLSDLNEDGAERETRYDFVESDVSKQRLAIHIPMGAINIVNVFAVGTPEFNEIDF